MYIALHVVDVHAKSRRSSPMDPCVHVIARQVELPHECIGRVVEHQRDVVMHTAIATRLPAPHVAHICVMNAMIFIPASILGVLDLGTHGCKELRDECIAEQYISGDMARHIQIKSYHADAAVMLKCAI